jgi:hypothetical protein
LKHCYDTAQRKLLENAAAADEINTAHEVQLQV